MEPSRDITRLIEIMEALRQPETGCPWDVVQTFETIKPYTIEEVERLAKSGVKRMAMVAPGFSADCLETLEELDMENREVFMEHGGEQFAYIPCLNDSAAGARVIEAVVRRELMGWM